MHKTLAVPLIAILFLSVGEAKDKAKDTVQNTAFIYSNVKVFDNTCDTVWGTAISNLSAMRMSIVSTDHSGGVINFTSTGEGRAIKVVANPGKGRWKSYKVDSGIALLQPTEQENQCKCTIKINYLGLKAEMTSLSWYPVPSNNLSEYLLLTGMETELSEEIQQKK